MANQRSFYLRAALLMSSVAAAAACGSTFDVRYEPEGDAGSGGTGAGGTGAAGGAGAGGTGAGGTGAGGTGAGGTGAGGTGAGGTGAGGTGAGGTGAGGTGAGGTGAGGAPGLDLLGPSLARTHELGLSTTFTVSLQSPPADDVTVTVSTSDPTEGEASPSALEFTSLTWSDPQTVTVTGVAEAGLDGDVEYQVQLRASSSDAGYNQLPTENVGLTNEDFVLRRASVKQAGGLENGHARIASPSNGGEFILFETHAALAPEDVNAKQDVYLYDATDQGVTLISAKDGVASTSYAYPGSHPVITPDGRFLAFGAQVPLTSNDAPWWDVYVLDRDEPSPEPERVSLLQNHGSAFYPGISDDGRFVVYEAYAGPAEFQGEHHVYLFDRNLSATRLVPTDTGEADGAAYSAKPTLSGDGTKIAFSSRTAGDVWYANVQGVTAGDSQGSWPMGADNGFRPALSSSGELAAYGVNGSVAIRGPEGVLASIPGVAPRDGGGATISRDGRFVVFVSAVDSLVTGDEGQDDVFVWDRTVNRIVRASITSGAAQANGDVLYAAISPDGAAVAFSTQATNMDPGDTNGVTDVYVVQLDAALWSRAEGFTP